MGSAKKKENVRNLIYNSSWVQATLVIRGFGIRSFGIRGFDYSQIEKQGKTANTKEKNI